MKTFADHIIRYNRELHFPGKIPDEFKVLNPFQDNPEILKISEAFYRNFYNDQKTRKIIIGINPGRLGAGMTGIPFTDSKRLTEICNIPISSVSTHELSSVFIYDVISRYGGPKKFYQDFYITSVCPLGLIRKNDKSHWVNCNYYDDIKLFEMLRGFITDHLKTQIQFGIETKNCIILGKKNKNFFEKINCQEMLFEEDRLLEHPRYIEQYKQKERGSYIEKYLQTLKEISST